MAFRSSIHSCTLEQLPALGTLPITLWLPVTRAESATGQLLHPLSAPAPSTLPEMTTTPRSSSGYETVSWKDRKFSTSTR